MQRATWADLRRGYAAAARAEADRAQRAGAPPPDVALDAGFDLWRLRPELFGQRAEGTDVREEARARAAWVRLRRAWRG